MAAESGVGGGTDGDAITEAPSMGKVDDSVGGRLQSERGGTTPGIESEKIASLGPVLVPTSL